MLDKVGKVSWRKYRSGLLLENFCTEDSSVSQIRNKTLPLKQVTD